MRSLRVFQVHNRYRQAGGEDTVVAREAALLRSAGHDVVEFHTSNPDETLSAGLTLLAAPWNLRAAGRLRSAAEEHRPDVVHIHNTWWALSPASIRVLAKLDVPIVMTLHNYRLLCVNAMLFRDGKPCEDCVGSHPWHGVQHACYRDSRAASTIAASTIDLHRRLRTWDSVDSLLALTEFARDRFLAGGLSPEKLRVKQNFVDDPGRRYGEPSASKMVVVVGRISAEKGIRTLLEAWRRAAPVGLELVVIGDGPLRQELEKQSQSSVRFVGSASSAEVADYMLRARALAFPSVVYEGQPMVLLEALAAGLPLVISSLGGIPETAHDDRAVLRAEAGDADSWAAALAGLEDADWVDQAGRAARRVFETRYTPELALAGLIDVYEQAIRSK